MTRTRCWCGKGRLYHRFRLAAPQRVWHEITPQIPGALLDGMQRGHRESTPDEQEAEMTDPDNANPNGRTIPVLTQDHQDHRDDRRRRVVALAVALLSGLALLPSIFLAAFVDWVWLPVGLGVWFVGSVVASSVATYVYGPARRKP